MRYNSDTFECSSNSHKKSKQDWNCSERNRAKTFSTQKQLLSDRYNWAVEFPSTAIHSSSIMYRDAEQNRSFKIKLRTINDRAMLGPNATSNFGGSCQNLAENKVKNGFWFDRKLAKSDQSIAELKDSHKNALSPSTIPTKNSKSLLNLITFPFNNNKNKVVSSGANRDSVDKNWKQKIVGFWKRKSNKNG